jgi:putative toxin-antitoxin system antitoxin component (TIGR02293 family)
MSKATDKSLLAPRRSRGKRKASGSSTRQAQVAYSAALPVATRVEEPVGISYGPKTGFNVYIRRVSDATPMEIVLTERAGVHARLIKDLAKHMAIPASRLFAILGVPKATAEKKVAAGEMVAGQGGQAVIGMIKLLGIAQDMVANSRSDDAKGFDAAKWLGRWIEVPQPSLGGRKPAELLDTPTGVEIVARLLGAIESGAYQ